MSQFVLYGLTSLCLVCIGLHHLVVQRHLVRKILALNVVGSGVFLLLIAVARRNEGVAPDPVPHAMVLTGIVIAVSLSALALGIVRRIQEEPHGSEPEEGGAP